MPVPIVDAFETIEIKHNKAHKLAAKRALMLTDRARIESIAAMTVSAKKTTLAFHDSMIVTYSVLDGC
jgi:hypothetical protein